MSEKPVGVGISEAPAGHQSLISAGKNYIKNISEDQKFYASPCNAQPIIIGISTTELLKSERNLANNLNNENNNPNNTQNVLLPSGD